MNKINNYTLSFIIICLINSNLLGIIFPYIINNSYYSFIYTLLLSFIISIILILLFYKLLNTLPSKNIFEKINIIYENKTSKVIKGILLLIFLLNSSLVFFRFSSFVANEYLTETPSIIICLLLSLPIFISSKKDINTLGRIASSIVYATSIMFIFSRLSLIPHISIDNLKPIVFDNPFNILKDSLVVSILNIGPLFTMLVISKENIINNKNTLKAIILSYIFSFLLITIILLTIIGVLGIDISKIYTYPSYMVLKNINILNFIKNVQNFSVLFWIMFMSFTSSFNLSIIRKELNVKNNKILFIIFFLISIFIFSKESIINRYNNLYALLPFYLYLFLIIILFTSLLIYLCKSK